MRPVAAPVVALVAACLGLTSAAEARPLRILSLDQCADQYVLALAPDAELALSPRADDPDSWMREAAQGHRRVRPTYEALVAFRPDVVVRYWGGDARLVSSLERRGVRVATIADTADFDGVRANIDSVALALDRPEAGRALIARMDARLAESRLAEAGQGGSKGEALYLTAGGFTAGSGTLIDAILAAAGYRNAVRAAGYRVAGVERLILEPPMRLVLGFFDMVRSDWRGAGRHPAVRRATRGRTATQLPSAALTCPAWFAADAAAMLAEAGEP